jgi:hypothetical protein
MKALLPIPLQEFKIGGPHGHSQAICIQNSLQVQLLVGHDLQRVGEQQYEAWCWSDG